MKTTHLILCSWITGMLITACPLHAQSQEAAVSGPGPGWASVTIPYADWMELWNRTRPDPEEEVTKPEPPPVEAVVLSADYHLSLDPENTGLSVQFHIQALADTWQTIPLVGGDLRLSSLGNDPTRTVLWKDNQYSLLTKGVGNIELNLEFAVPPLGSWGSTDGFRFSSATSSLNRLSITGVPENHRITVQGLLPTTETGDETIFHLPGSSADYMLVVDRYEPLPPPVRSQWKIDSEWIAHYRDGRIQYAGMVYATADDGSGLETEFILPGDALSVEYSAEDLEKGDMRRRPDGSRQLTLYWKTRDILDRRVRMMYEIPQSPLADQWELKAPRAAENDQSRTLFVIPAIDGLELNGAGMLDSIQSRRLPEWMGSEIRNRAFSTVETEQQCTLQINWLPRLQTAQAVVNQAEYSTRLVQDGSLLISAKFTIQHQNPINWRIEMPQIDQILSCSVNGQASQPIKRGSNEIEFPLSTSENGLSTVAFSYTAQTEALDPVSGRIALTLPQTSLFIDRLQWVLNIPKAYEATALEGNVTIAGPEFQFATQPSSSSICLVKELVREEHPSVELYYQKKGLE